jgi:hypothetical protein
MFHCNTCIIKKKLTPLLEALQFNNHAQSTIVTKRLNTIMQKRDFFVFCFCLVLMVIALIRFLLCKMIDIWVTQGLYESIAMVLVAQLQLMQKLCCMFLFFQANGCKDFNIGLWFCILGILSFQDPSCDGNFWSRFYLLKCTKFPL